MAPFIVVALVAGSLFGTGTVIKPKEPVVGTALQGAGIGTLIGGGLGAAAGTTVGTASFFGTTGVAATTSAAAVTGGAIGATGGAVVGGVDTLFPGTKK